MKSLVLTGLALVMSLPAFAKVESNYSVSILSQNSMPQAEIITYLNGWSCNASTYVTYSEYARNHAGKVVRIPKTSQSQGTWSTLYSGGQGFVSMNFIRDLYNSDPTVNVGIRENCGKTETKTVYKETCDDQGKHCRWGYVEEIEHKTAYVSWSCDFNQLPTRTGQSLSMMCKPYSNSGLYDLDGYITSLFRQKEITATIHLNSSQQSFARDFCREGEEANATILHFEQGLGGHGFENDFELEVGVNGESIPLKSKNGIYSEDIRLCPAQGQQDIALNIKAFERDWKYDDVYTSDQSEQITVPLRAGNVKEVSFTRKSYSAHIFTPKKSSVLIKTLK